MQDTLQHALMCIEVLAVAGNIIVLLLWAVGPYFWSHVCSVVLGVGDKNEIYAIETLDPWNLFLRCLQPQFLGDN